jgi:predicted DNA-binding transcriptional regulator AlpA
MSEENKVGLPSARLLSTEQAASYCGMSPNHFKAHVRVRPLKFGGSVRYDRKTLDEWLDALRNPSPKRAGVGLGNARKDRAN